MHDRIDALKEKYKQKIVEHESSDSSAEGYPPEFLDKKLNVCHVTPENSDDAHTINISVNALRDHLAHGDYLDECEDQTNEETEEDTEDITVEETDGTAEEETEDTTEEDGKEIKVELKEELGLKQSD